MVDIDLIFVVIEFFKPSQILRKNLFKKLNKKRYIDLNIESIKIELRFQSGSRRDN